jgi:hypothetical protein
MTGTTSNHSSSGLGDAVKKGVGLVHVSFAFNPVPSTY